MEKNEKKNIYEYVNYINLFFHNNVINGKTREYYNNGKIKFKGEYMNGKKME